MLNQKYNEMIENYKNEMDKKQQEYFLIDLLHMDYGEKLTKKFIKILEGNLK